MFIARLRFVSIKVSTSCERTQPIQKPFEKMNFAISHSHFSEYTRLPMKSFGRRKILRPPSWNAVSIRISPVIKEMIFLYRRCFGTGSKNNYKMVGFYTDYSVEMIVFVVKEVFLIRARPNWVKRKCHINCIVKFIWSMLNNRNYREFSRLLFCIFITCAIYY